MKEEFTEEIDKLWENFLDEELVREEQEREKFEEALEYFKSNIDYPFEWFEDEILIENERMYHIGYVHIEQTDFPKYYSVTKEDSEKYNIECKFVKQNYYDKEYFVYQTCGFCEDDYSGYLALPIKEGLYWLVSFTC